MRFAYLHVHLSCFLLYFSVTVHNTLCKDVPRVLPLPIRLYLANGLTGIVECPVDANPPVTRVTWAINERLIDIRRLSHMRIGADGSLVIARVERKDEGRYSCTAYSSLGSGQMSTPVQVLVRGCCRI